MYNIFDKRVMFNGAIYGILKCFEEKLMKYFLIVPIWLMDYSGYSSRT